jgi:dienelactone hydrolase
VKGIAVVPEWWGVDSRSPTSWPQNLQRAKKPAEVHFYDAHHAFLNSRRPEVYDPAAARLAWEGTIMFLR